MPRWPKLWKQTLRLVMTAALLYAALRNVDAESVRGNLARIETASLVMLLFVYWGAQMVSAQRWRILASSLGVKGSYLSFLQAYFVGMFFNIGLPSLVGGDLIKSYIVSRKAGASMQSGIASSLQDRAAGLVALLFLGTCAIAYRPVSWRSIPLRWIYPVVWSALVFGLLALRAGERGVRTAASHSSSGMGKRLADFQHTLGTLRLGRRETVQCVVLSLINSLLVIWIMDRVCAAAGLSIELATIAALVPLIEILTALPISLAGVGIREWAFVEALATAGIAPDAALTAALATSALVVVRNLGGAVFLPMVPASLRAG